MAESREHSYLLSSLVDSVLDGVHCGLVCMVKLVNAEVDDLSRLCDDDEGRKQTGLRRNGGGVYID